MDNFQNFQILNNKITQIDNQIGQFMLEMKTLKTLVEGACENKYIMKDIMKLLDHMKEQHCIQITENQKYFDQQTSKYKYEIEELKAYAGSKDKEVVKLEERVMHQKHYINFCEDSIKRVEEYITEKVFNIHAINIEIKYCIYYIIIFNIFIFIIQLTILIPYTTNLEVTVANQMKIILQVAVSTSLNK